MALLSLKEKEKGSFISFLGIAYELIKEKTTYVDTNVKLIQEEEKSSKKCVNVCVNFRDWRGDRYMGTYI